MRQTTFLTMYALNFYSDLYGEVLRTNRKTVTIRLGDKTDKYRTGMVVWITIGPRFGRRQKLFSAILDRVEVKTLSELSPRDIERENPEFRTSDDVINILSRIYGDFITPEHRVTVIYFSRVDEY
ncbi:MAG TPA: hypothetical protein VK934_01390 [Fimbriimonas sp.]|nr:hypothetical protein [Fimbriimonas sp.]